MEKEKIVSVQYLRGLAALGVVFCHFGSDMKSHPKLSSFFSFGQSGIYVFFLISGFIIVYSLFKANYRVPQFFTFLLKRSIRIDPPYYVVILLTILLFRVLSSLPSFKGNLIPFVPAQLIAHMFYYVPFTKYQFYNHVFWTLCIEFQFYLLVGLLYFLFDNQIYKIVFLCLFACSFLIPFSNSYYLVFTYAPFFALGISLVYVYQNRSWLNTMLPIFCLSVVAYQFGLMIFLLILFSCVAIFYLKLAIKPLSFLGDISYSLYLIHPLVLIVFLGAGKKIGINFNNNQLVWLFVEVCVALTIAYLFYVLVERPSIRLSKRIFYKRTVEAS